jgi:hypothetical protein
MHKMTIPTENDRDIGNQFPLPADIGKCFDYAENSESHIAIFI